VAEIEFMTSGAGPLTIKVLDIAGNSIFMGSYPTASDKFSHRIDFSLLPQGHYFIRVSGESVDKTIKIIKTP
jgi:hypothetical protein